MAKVKHITIDTPDEEALRIIDEDAAVIIDDVISETEIDKILESKFAWIQKKLTIEKKDLKLKKKLIAEIKRTWPNNESRCINS